MRPLLCFVIAACTAAPSPPAETPDASPAIDAPLPPDHDVTYTKGCYTGVDSVGAVPPAIFANPGIVGVSVSIEWRDLEAAGDNQFDWSGLDARITEIEAHHKKVILSIVASAAKSPAWLVANPAVTKIQIPDPNPEHGNGVITLVPFWDPIFHAQKLELIKAAGQHFASDPEVMGVMTAFANYYTNDWAMPPEMKNASYSYATMLQVGKDVLGTMAQAFPNQAIKLPLGKNDPTMDPDKTETDMAADIVAWTQTMPFAARFYFQKNLINTASPTANDPRLVDPDPASNDWLLKMLRDLSPQMGLQMVASASGGAGDGCRQNAHQSPCPPYDVLQTSIAISLSYVPTYLEFWQADGMNPDLYPLLASATTTMTQ